MNMYRVGIDLGGTNIKVGIVNQQNEIVIEASIPTKVEREPELIIRDMANLTLQLLEQKKIPKSEILGVGIGSPGAIDTVNGIVLYSNNFNWENIELVARMKDNLKLPIYVSNDAQCAALGEVKAGAAKNCKDVIMLTLGTGVGSGIIIDGKIFEGGHTAGGIIGHTTLIKGGEQCTCGRRGCFEVYASASALIRETRKAAEAHPESKLNQLCEGDLSKINGKTVFDAARENDLVAKDVVNFYIECLGDGIVSMINIFRPEKVLLSGGICNQGKYLTDLLNKYIKQYCFAGDKIFIPKVERATLGNKAGIIGAASLVQ